MSDPAHKLTQRAEFEVGDAHRVLRSIFENVRKVILGKDESIIKALTCWLTGGHILLDDVPGTGKTMLARALAASIDVKTTRVQFTPDMLPADIIGTSILGQDRASFAFVGGPIFTTVLLADEINRATPRCQSALLEAMAEGQVSAENQTYTLSPHFFVIATQNPVDQHGTFPLPEAQLDRFMMKMSMGYPTAVVESQIVFQQLTQHPINKISSVTSEDEFGKIKHLIGSVTISKPMIQYATRIVTETRQHGYVALGASPRATIALVQAARTYALLKGESFLRPDHIKALAPYVIGHRLSLTPRAIMDGIKQGDIVSEILAKAPVPTA